MCIATHAHTQTIPHTPACIRSLSCIYIYDSQSIVDTPICIASSATNSMWLLIQQPCTSLCFPVCVCVSVWRLFCCLTLKNQAKAVLSVSKFRVCLIFFSLEFLNITVAVAVAIRLTERLREIFRLFVKSETNIIWQNQRKLVQQFIYSTEKFTKLASHAARQSRSRKCICTWHTNASLRLTWIKKCKHFYLHTNNRQSDRVRYTCTCSARWVRRAAPESS